MLATHYKPKSFEDRLNTYADSGKNTAGKTMNVGSIAGYCASTTAIFAMGTTEAEAAISIVDLNLDFNSSGPLDTILNIQGYGGSSDFFFQAIMDAPVDGAWDYVRMGANNGNRIKGRVYSPTFNYGSLLSMGEVFAGGGLLPSDLSVNTYLAFGPVGAYPKGGDWEGGNTGYLGFQLDNGGDKHLGWIELTINADNASGTIHRYGIETDPGVSSITIGVPEPSSLSCLAVGAAGLLGWRRRRDAAA